MYILSLYIHPHVFPNLCAHDYAQIRCSLTGSTMFWLGKGSSWRTWRKISMMGRFSRSSLVKHICLFIIGYIWLNIQLNSKIFSDLHLLYSNLALCFHPVEKLEGEKLNVAEVTQSEIAQKQKLQTVLERINDALKVSTRSIKWNVDCRLLELQHESF